MTEGEDTDADVFLFQTDSGLLRQQSSSHQHDQVRRDRCTPPSPFPSPISPLPPIQPTNPPQTQYSRDAIRINSVCPGVIDTPMTQPNASVLEPAISIAPMERMGTAQEVADCVLFLASSKASFVQGAAMVVDGGYTIN